MIDNTQGWKDRFIALYIGHKLIVNYQDLNEAHECEILGVVGNDVYFKSAFGGHDITDEWVVILRDISSLTDEEKMKIYHIHCQEIAYDYTQDFGTHLQSANHWLSKDPKKTIYKYTACADYLRSIGIAIPFMGTPVSTLIEWEWCKLV